MQAIVDKYFKKQEDQKRPKTVEGLCLALGFRSRQSLLNYEHKKKAFRDVIQLAKLQCQEYTAEALFSNRTFQGAKFSLQNNFDYKDETTQNLNGAIKLEDLICSGSEGSGK